MREAPAPRATSAAALEGGRPAGRQPPAGIRKGVGVDVLLGIVLPALCLAVDPVVFRSWIDLPVSTPLLGEYSAFGYVATGMGMVGLSLWLTFGRFPAFFSGLLAAEAVFALFLGAGMRPFSIIGAVFGVGLLGLAPFLTGFVLGRNASRAFRVSGFAMRPGVALAAFTLGALLAVGVPTAAHLTVKRAVRDSLLQVLADDPAKASGAVSTLAMLAWASPMEELVTAYESERNPDRQKRIEAAYLKIKGVSIATRTED